MSLQSSRHVQTKVIPENQSEEESKIKTPPVESVFQPIAGLPNENSRTEFEGSLEEEKLDKTQEADINLVEGAMEDDSHLLTITERTLEDTGEEDDDDTSSEVSMSQMLMEELKSKLNHRKGEQKQAKRKSKVMLIEDEQAQAK